MLAVAVVLAQLAGVLDVSNTSRIDARVNQPMPIVPQLPPREVAVASDATISPVARLHLNDRRWDYTLTYSPTFNVTDIELVSTAQPVVLNAGTASIAWHDRQVRVMVSESASYGLENLAYLYETPAVGLTPGQTQAPGQTAAAPTTVQMPGQTAGQSLSQTGAASTVPMQVFPFGSSNTSATVTDRTSPSVLLAMTGGYSVSGNLANSTQVTAVYPEQLASTGAASVIYTASRLDSLATVASAAETTTPAGACIPAVAGRTCSQVTPMLTVAESWRRRTSPTSTFSATLGLSGTIYQLDSGQAWGILPTGGVEYTDRFGPPSKDPRDLLEPTGVRLSADLAPTINVFTGYPSNRVQLNASLADRFTSDASISLQVGTLQTVPLPHPDPSPLTVVTGGLDLHIRLHRLMTLSLGVQGLWQQQQNVGAIPVATTNVPSQTAVEVGYVSLTVRLPRLRL